jgi:predicted Zn-ribbon and HTH transcriptional regulator
MDDHDGTCNTLNSNEERTWISNELRRELWHSRMPGRSTEEKIRSLLDFYNEYSATAEQMANQRNEMPEEPDQFVSLPDGMINIIVDVQCLDCETVGYTDMLIREDGWYLKTRIKCPVCESERIAVSDFKVRKDAGL